MINLMKIVLIFNNPNNKRSYKYHTLNKIFNRKNQMNLLIIINKIRMLLRGKTQYYFTMMARNIRNSIKAIYTHLTMRERMNNIINITMMKMEMIQTMKNMNVISIKLIKLLRAIELN